MIPITQNYILHELEFIETRRYTINNSSLHKTHGTVNMLNLVDGKSAAIEGDFEPFIVHYAVNRINIINNSNKKPPRKARSG